MSAEPVGGGTPTVPGLEPNGAGPAEPVVVRRVRPGAGPDPLRVLLLHGLCGSAAIWDGFAGLADPDWELWAADLPWRGTGVTGWADRPVEDWAARAVADLPGGADVLMAHSFGTSVVLRWLDRQATGPDGGFVVGGGGCAGWCWSRRSTGPTRTTSTGTRSSTTSTGSTGSSPTACSPGPAGRCRPTSCGPSRSRSGTWSARTGGCGSSTPTCGSPRSVSERLTVPALVVGGGLDTAALPADAEALGRALPAATVHLLPGTRHYPMITAAEAFAELTNSFLRSVAAAP